MERYGSVENRMDEGKQVGALRVGMGATEMCWSDRIPYAVQQVVSPSHVIVAEDMRTRIDSNGRSECQEHEYESVPLWVGETKLRCSRFLYMQIGTDECQRKADERCCMGCSRFKRSTPTNGIRLIKAKRGRKALRQDRRFALGIREKYEDPTF